MGNDVETSSGANMEITPYDKTMSNMKIGVCEMQGWRHTMEDAAIVLPNFQPNTSLFQVVNYRKAHAYHKEYGYEEGVHRDRQHQRYQSHRHQHIDQGLVLGDVLHIVVYGAHSADEALLVSNVPDLVNGDQGLVRSRRTLKEYDHQR